VTKKSRGTAYLDAERINSQMTIYRDARTKAKNYIARVLLETGKYKLVSLKTDDRHRAIAKAQRIFDDIKLRERQHLPLKDVSVREILEHWLATDGSRLTKRRAMIVERWFNKKLSPFINEVLGSSKGLDIPCRALKQSDLKRFPFWRLEDAKKKKGIARTTLGLEIGNFNVVSRCAKRDKLVDVELLIPTLGQTNIEVKRTEVRPSQNTYTRSQIDALSNYFKRHFLHPGNAWNKGLCMTDENGEGVRGDNGAIRSKGGRYISRINLYCSFFILLNTGMRLSELYSLKWKDIEKILVDHDAKGRPRHIWMLRVGETKPYRVVKAMVPRKRPVVGPARLEAMFDRIRTENPDHCKPDDYIINSQGRRKKSQQVLFEQVQAKITKWNGREIDCSRHSSGTDLDLRHIRSFYVSHMLIQRGVAPQLLTRQTGHSLETILKYYLTSEPMKVQKLTFGQWTVDEGLVKETLNLSI